MSAPSIGFVAALLLLAAPVAAQSTGGSFGGRASSWERSSGSSSGGALGIERSAPSAPPRFDFGAPASRPPRDFGAGRVPGADLDHGRVPSRAPSMRHAWMEGRRDQSGGGPPVLAQERDVQRRPTPLVPFFVGPAAIFAVLLGLVFVPWGRLRRRQRSAPVEPIDPPAPIWLVRLSVGFDWTARPALQQELDALSRFLDVDTDAARALSAARLLALLHAHVSSACYACAHAEALDAQRGPPRLEALALDLRARFRHETRGARASGPSTVQARPEEGPGMLVVSVVLAMRRGVALPAVVDRASLAAALRLPLGPELPALEVVWSPAESNDRMSSYELERLYHELARLSDATHVGGARCGFCGTPRATEVPRCVRCGAAA